MTNSKIRVLHVIDSLGLGGAQTVVKGIVEHNADHAVFSLRVKGKNLPIDSPKVFICPAHGKYNLRSFFDLYRLVRKEKVEVLHCHLQKSGIYGFIIKSFLFPKIRFIFHEHGGEVNYKRLDYRWFLFLVSVKAEK